MLGALIGITVIFAIGALSWIIYSISTKGKIVTRDEQSRAAVASMEAMQQTSQRVMEDAIEGVTLYFNSLQKVLQESRALLKNRSNEASLSDGQLKLQQIFEVYPKRTGEEVFRQLLVIMAKERDDVQYAKEKANAYIAEYNAVVKGPISHIVAQAMNKIEKDYFATAEEPLLKALLAEAGKDLLSLISHPEEELKKRTKLNKKKTDDSTEEGESDD